MTTRIDILNSLIDCLEKIDGRSSPWDASYTFNTSVQQVFAKSLFLDEINSFPTITMLIDEETISHIGGNIRYSTLNIDLRGYTYDEAVEESGEELAEDIEHVFEYVRQYDPRIEEIRLVEINTDSGLNAPYGIVLITLQVLFQR